MLQSPRFIAAPLDWITVRNSTSSKRIFSEWLVVAIKVHNTAVTHSENGKFRTIRCTEYESIPFRSMSTWKTVVDASMILEQTNATLRTAANAAILMRDKWQCIHCRCESPTHWFQGNVLMDNMECPCCRRMNVFTFNVEERMVMCFDRECGKESTLREFVIDWKSGKGARCPQCGQWQSECFVKSEMYQMVMEYLSDDTEYKKVKEISEDSKMEHQRAVLVAPYSIGQGNMVNSGGVMVVDEDVEEKSNGKSGSLFRWNGKDRKKSKPVSMNLSNVETNVSIIEDDFD